VTTKTLENQEVVLAYIPLQCI